MTFEQWGIFIVSLVMRGNLIFEVSSEGPQCLVASYDNPGKRRSYYEPDPHWTTIYGGQSKFLTLFVTMNISEDINVSNIGLYFI